MWVTFQIVLRLSILGQKKKKENPTLWYAGAVECRHDSAQLFKCGDLLFIASASPFNQLSLFVFKSVIYIFQNAFWHPLENTPIINSAVVKCRRTE